MCGRHASRCETVVDLDTEVEEMFNVWNVYPLTVHSPFLGERQFDQLRQSYRYAKYISCVRLLGGIDLKEDDYFRGADDRGEAVCDFTGQEELNRHAGRPSRRRACRIHGPA